MKSTVSLTDYIQLQVLSYWVEQGIAYRPKITVSVEHILTQDGEAFVDTLYSEVLGRTPDEQGRAHHMKLLQSGVSKNELIHSLLESDEAQTRDIVLDQSIEPLAHHPDQKSLSVRLKRIIRQFIPGL